MNIQINLPAEYEQALHQQAAAHGRDVDSFVNDLITEDLADAVASRKRMSSKRESFGEWLDSWIARHPVLDHAVDDSRESIYEGRGE